MKKLSLILLLTLMSSPLYCAETGNYFSKKEYTEQAIPSFKSSKDKLPQPILDDHPGLLEMYWKCWEIAFHGIKKPAPDSPLVSNWLDEAFSNNIFQWDSIFMMMFARYGHDSFPAIQSLDNFYALQRDSGYIGREFNENSGRIIHYDHVGGLFAKTGWKNTINPPLFAWAEVESYRLTGDKSRFTMILPVLEKYAEWLNRNGDPDAKDWENNGRISKSTKHQLYWNTPLGSGMDNSPRPTKKGSGWVEMSSQMVIMYNNLAIIAQELGKDAKATQFRSEAQAIAKRVNKWCWNDEDKFYYDVLADGSQYKKMTMGGFWPLLAKIASEQQAQHLVAHLKDPQKFWRPFVFPTVAADEPEYDPRGNYWLGGVWAPTNVMVIKGLENYGYNEFAALATQKYLEAMLKVFQERGTVYENYCPEEIRPGYGEFGAKPDFVGWSGCGPIQLLFENLMGFRPEGSINQLTWYLRLNSRHGVEKFKLGSNTISLICEKRASLDAPAHIRVESLKAFKLVIIHGDKKRTIMISAGKTTLNLK